jgi:hypothetical protein
VISFTLVERLHHFHGKHALHFDDNRTAVQGRMQFADLGECLGTPGRIGLRGEVTGAITDAADDERVGCAMGLS